MCGIVGYVGKLEAVPILIEGLRRLEYRGYDSAGIASMERGGISVRKEVGRIDDLTKAISQHPLGGTTGISHTRWATHGKVTRDNAHPQLDRSGKLALVHNGVIENYASIRLMLEQEGHQFSSQTDTEVLAHLLGRAFDRFAEHTQGTLISAVRDALRQVSGTYGIAIIHADLPGIIIGARRGSPLVLGIGRDAHFLASDVSAIVGHTKEVVYLNDYEIAAITEEGFNISTIEGNGADYNITTVDIIHEDIDKGHYPHFMLKEIHEQIRSTTDALRGRLSKEENTAKLGGLNMTNADLRSIERIVLIGCGSALHAAMVGEYLIESLAQIPTECEYASEFRYRNLPMTKDTLVFVLSQSGETADTLAALRESKRKGHRTLGICNNVASTIARESDGGVYMHAGAEIGVAATKSFTSQVIILTLIAFLLGRIRNLSSSAGNRIIEELEMLPLQIEKVLQWEHAIAKVAKKYAKSKVMLFMGRQYNYPVALEGALKLKEISYIAAMGFTSAELKHGVIALVNEETPSVIIAPHDSVFTKNLSTIQEIKTRGGPVIAIGTEEKGEELGMLCDDVILIPRTSENLTPILATIVLQFFAYHIAIELGCDVDKPRNLAKSVTVE